MLSDDPLSSREVYRFLHSRGRWMLFRSTLTTCLFAAVSRNGPCRGLVVCRAGRFPRPPQKPHQPRSCAMGCCVSPPLLVRCAFGWETCPPVLVPAIYRPLLPPSLPRRRARRCLSSGRRYFFLVSLPWSSDVELFLAPHFCIHHHPCRAADVLWDDTCRRDALLATSPKRARPPWSLSQLRSSESSTP